MFERRSRFFFALFLLFGGSCAVESPFGREGDSLLFCAILEAVQKRKPAVRLLLFSLTHLFFGKKVGGHKTKEKEEEAK